MARGRKPAPGMEDGGQTLNIKIPTKLAEKLEKRAAKAGVSKATVAREALEKGLGA